MPPVEDKPVHDKVRKTAGSVYGCHSSKRRLPGMAPGYWAPNRVYREDRTWSLLQMFVPHVMSTGCCYDNPADPSCVGCARQNPNPKKDG